jgi:hypothetical protein
MASELSPNAKLIALSKALRNLHKQIIDVETKYFGSVGSPLEHLHLVVNHPHFSWIQKLSSLMAQIDERLDEPEEVSVAEAFAFRVAIEELIGPNDNGDMAFRANYNALLHDAPDVVMMHGAVRQVLINIHPK